MEYRSNSAILVILLLAMATSALAITGLDNVVYLAQAKKSHGHSSITTSSQSNKPGSFVPGTTGGGFAVQPPPGTEPLTTDTANNSAAALAIAHRLAITSVNASKTQTKLGTPCLPQLNRFILPVKEARFTVIKQCVTVTGRVVWTHYFNDDGDANFNIVLDLPYKDMLGPGSYSKVFASKYPGGPAIHAETVCQGPVTSKSPENVGACNGYNGPNFKPVLPKIGQHVMVTGRYLIEMPEMPGGITELHPVYGIKILP
ncbi:hypothetical protein [Nitrososphaera sp. AFS]|uniref:hypothetical protein n=1 Tax=Nitrososphaera sp. AFS TaxID=2301191 RepID=UPI0013924299|nr:hypothetical protein [Nitrososphaera sp. AFS]NAL77713.1 hypothetical protein [Nitrososphaera sp. AFS]